MVGPATELRQSRQFIVCFRGALVAADLQIPNDGHRRFSFLQRVDWASVEVEISRVDGRAFRAWIKLKVQRLGNVLFNESEIVTVNFSIGG